MAQEKLFSFNTPEFPNYALEVVSFKGYQEMGELYRYEIDLISKEQDIDFDKILQSEVSLQLHNKNKDDIYIHGVLEHFEAHQKIDDSIYYRAYLVPKLWWLTLAQHQQIFLDKKVGDILESILKDARFTSNDYEFRLQRSYKKREYVCQYKESRYDFIKRWMHRDGIYFYFESNENGCKIIFTDTKDTQRKLPNMDEMLYKPVSGLQEYENQAVSSIVYRSNNTLKSVRMKNYNYEKPSLDINSATDSSVDEYAQTYLFGNNLKSQDEAKKLSEINAQKYKCLDKEMSGESNILSLTAGNIYTLKDYFKKDLNGEYLMVRVEVEASQRGFLSAGFSEDSQESSYYHNTFMMIPAQTQYRMQTTSLWPHIGGMISATIDGQGSGDTAELDKHGRYKVIMPFDLSGRDNAKASAYLRMAQPSAGEKQGIHFPLHKGTEVLIAFKGGDPDQPIITGAVPNVNTPSPVNEDNVTKSIIQTHGGNIIHMEDTPGKAHIKMAVHDDLSSITIHNKDDDDPEADWGVAVKTVSGCQFISADFSNTIGGNKEEVVAGLSESLQIGAALEVFVGAKAEYTGGQLLEMFQGGEKRLTPESKKLAVVSKKVGVSDEEVKEIKRSAIETMEQTVVNRTEITEDMILDMVKSIVTGMNLTEALEEKISTIQESIESVESSISVHSEDIEDVEDSIDMIDRSLKTIETMFGSLGSVIEQIDAYNSKFDFHSAINSLKINGNNLTIFE